MTDDGITITDNVISITTARPTRADAVKNRALLLDTARQLADDLGMDHVSMNAIAETAGVGKGTLYRHFSNKAELCQAMLDHDQQALQERTITRLREQADAPADMLQWFLGEVLDFVWKHRDLLGATDQIDLLGHPAHLWWRQTIRGLLSKLVPAPDVEYFTDMLYVMIDIRTVSYQQTRFGYTKEQTITGLWQAVERLTKP